MQPTAALVLIAAAFVAVASAGRIDAQLLPPYYSAKEVRATVVDEATGQPLEGAVVVAQWVLYRSMIGHGGHGPRLHVTEAVTDGAGVFVIPAWGPKLRPPLTHLAHRAPELLIFKGGYLPREETNNLYTDEVAPTVTQSEWHGKAIGLKRPAMSDEYLSGLVWAFDSVAYDDSKYTPRFFEAIAGERRYFDANRPRNTRRLTELFVSVDERLRVIREERPR